MTLNSRFSCIIQQSDRILSTHSHALLVTAFDGRARKGLSSEANGEKKLMEDGAQSHQAWPRVKYLLEREKVH